MVGQSWLPQRVLPVIAIDDAGSSVALGEAVVAGGISCVEITLRTPVAYDAIERMREIAGLSVGAGTVTRPDQVPQAVAAGAQFIVSPGFSEEVAEECSALGVQHIPGVATPTDITAALNLGLDLLKFFPAGALGGVSTLKALSGPFGAVSFVPTGGIGPENLQDYLSLPNVAAVGGSWMVARHLIADRRFEEITKLSREAVSLAGNADGGAS